jgi:O-antigen ligase
MSSVPIVLQPQVHVPLDWQTAVFFALLFVIAAFATRMRSSFGVAAMLAVDPFSLYRYVGATTVTIPKVVLLGVAVGLIARNPPMRAFRDRRIGAILVTAAGLVAVTILASLPAAHRSDALRETLKACEYLIAFLIAGICFAMDPNERIVRWSLTLSVIVVTALALAQDYTVAPAGMMLGGTLFPRIAGPLDGPNQLAGYFEIAIPLLLAFRLARGSGPVLDLALIAATFATLLTFSRGGIVGLVLGALTVAFASASSRVTRPFVATVMALSVVAAVAFGALVISGHGGQLANAPLLGRASDTESGAASPTEFSGLGTRAELWKAAWAMWRAHPLLGVGPGNYELELAHYGAPGIRTHANSLYLQALAEGGILMLAAMLALLAAALATLVRYAESPLAIGALGATVALAAHQVVDDLFFYPKVGELWWIVLGVAAATIVRSSAPLRRV